MGTPPGNDSKDISFSVLALLNKLNSLIFIENVSGPSTEIEPGFSNSHIFTFRFSRFLSFATYFLEIWSDIEEK